MYVQVLKQGQVLECHPLAAPVGVEGMLVDLHTCGRVRVYPSRASWHGELKVQVVAASSAVAEPRLPVSSDGPDERTQVGEHLPQLEGFQVESLIGQGGMGSVWRAVQRSTGRPVAVKLLRGGAFGSARARARFDREVELLARLDHPHVARLYHSGIYQGLYFYAMELVEGVPLDQFVRERRPPMRQQLVLFEKICRAVHYAHRRGVIHRDLKPSNILVTDDLEPKVVDFGLAKAVNEEVALTADPVSIDGNLVGTLAYMAPEQAAGDIARIDTRSDVYSLGVVLYELLTARLPHEAAQSHADLHHRVMHVEPPRPTQVNRQVDRELEAIVVRAMQRTIDERYPDVGELADDIQRYRVGDPLRARPLTLGYVLRKRLTQHKARVVALALVLSLLLAFAGYAYARIANERNRAEAHAAQAQLALYQHRVLLAKAELERNHIARAVELLDACPEPLRHLEWHYLRRQVDASVRTIEAGDGPLQDLAFDLEARVARTLTRSGFLRTWDLSGGGVLHQPIPVTGEAEQVAFNASGSHLLAYQAGWLDLILAKDGTRLARMPWQSASPVRMAGSSDGLLWAIADTDGHLLLIDALSGETAWSIALPARGTALLFGADGQLAVAAVSQVARFLASADGAPDPRWHMSDGPVETLAFSEDGRWLAVGNRLGGVEVLHRDTEEPTHRIEIMQDRAIRSLSFGADGEQIVAGGLDGSIEVWLWERGEHVVSLRGHTTNLRRAAFCSTTNLLVSADAAGTIKLWRSSDLSSQPTAALFPDQPVSFPLASVWRDGDLVVALASGDETVVWRTAHDRRELIAAADYAASSAAFSLTGDLLALASDDHVDVWGVGLSLERLSRIPTEDALAGDLAFCPEGTLLAGWTRQGLFVWNARSGETLARLPGQPPLAFDPQTRLLWSAVHDEPSRLVAWDVNGRSPVAELAGPGDSPWRSIAVAPDGSRVAAATLAGEVQVWDATDGRRVQRWLSGEERPAPRLLFSADGRRLLTVGRAIRVWDASAGQELLTLNTPSRLLELHAVDVDSALVGVTSGSILHWRVR